MWPFDYLKKLWKKSKVLDQDILSMESLPESRNHTELFVSHKPHNSISTNLELCRREIGDYSIREETKKSYIDQVDISDIKFTTEDTLYWDSHVTDEDALKLKKQYNIELYHRGSAFPNVSRYLKSMSKIPKYWMGAPKFLIKHDMPKVVLASFPGSEWEVLRNYLQLVTCILTGSDTDYSIVDEVYSSQHFKGDGIINKKDKKKVCEEDIQDPNCTSSLQLLVWMVNSHYPYVMPSKKYKTNVCVLLVRNPAECLLSFYKMQYLNENKEISIDDVDEFDESIDNFLKQKTKSWWDFYNYWMHTERGVPVYVIKYEQLMKNPLQQLTKLMWYLVGCSEDSTQNTLLELLLKRAVKNNLTQNVLPAEDFQLSNLQKNQLAEKTNMMCDRLGYSMHTDEDSLVRKSSADRQYMGRNIKQMNEFSIQRVLDFTKGVTKLPFETIAV